MGANRRFGLVLITVCGLVYAYGYWYGSPSAAWLIAALVLCRHHGGHAEDSAAAAGTFG